MTLCFIAMLTIVKLVLGGHDTSAILVTRLTLLTNAQRHISTRLAVSELYANHVTQRNKADQDV